MFGRFEFGDGIVQVSLFCAAVTVEDGELAESDFDAVVLRDTGFDAFDAFDAADGGDEPAEKRERGVWVFGDEGREELVEAGVVRLCSRAESVLAGVAAGGSFPGGGAGSGALAGVATVGGDLGGGRHLVLL